MKFLLLIYHNPAMVPSESEMARWMAGHAALHQELTEAGTLVSSASLTAPPQATTVRVREGAPAVTDGPFLEAKEHLAGYYLVDCSLPQALEIAGRIPCGLAGGVEVRPVDEAVTRAVRGD